MLVSPAQAEVDRHREENQHAYQVNFTQALSKLKDTIVLLFDRSKEVAMLLIGSLFDIFVTTVEPIRPNRKNPRPKRVQRKGFYVSYSFSEK